MRSEFERINIVRDGFRPEARPHIEAAARSFFQEKRIPIDLDDLRRGFPTAGNPFDAVRDDQIPSSLSADDRDTFIILLLDLWNHTPFETLGGRTPAEALDAGEWPSGGPAALCASLARFLGIPSGARPAPFLEKKEVKDLGRAEDWIFAHLVPLGASPYQLIEGKRLPPAPDPSDLPPPGKRLRTFEEDVALLESANPEIRSCAAIRIAMSRDPRSREVHLRLLDDPDAPIIDLAMGFLRDSGSREARDAVAGRMGEWEDIDEDLLGTAMELIAASGAPEDLRALIGRLEEKRDPTWLHHALPLMDDAMRAEASAALVRSMGSGRRALRSWPWILLLGVRGDVREVTRRCIEVLRSIRPEIVPFHEMASALDLDTHLHADLARSLRPGPAAIPLDEEDESGLVPIEPDPAVLADIRRRLGPQDERFRAIHDPGEEGAALGEAGAWLLEASEASAARNPVFAREAARLAGIGEAVAETRSKPLDAGPKADGLLALCLLLLVRATWGRSSKEEVPLLGPDPSPEALLRLHLGETVSPAAALIEPLARCVAPEALIGSLSGGSLPVAFRAARALVLGHGEKHLPSIEPLLGRSTGRAIEFLDWARPHLGDAVVLPAARLFRRYPEMETAGILSRACAAMATERSRAVFRLYEPHLIRFGDLYDLGLDVLILGDRGAAEEYLDEIVAEAEAHGIPDEMLYDGSIEAMGILHGMEERAGAVIEKLRRILDRESEDHDIFRDDSYEPPPPPPPVEPLRREGPKTGRNDPCPCGSGKKFKKCCGRT